MGTIETGGDSLDFGKLEQLISKPLRELTIAELDVYASKAMTTWGDQRHFKHFLPRLLELAAEAPDKFLSIEVLFGKLRYADWLDWPMSEQAVILEFFREAWERVLARPYRGAGDDVSDSMLCAFACASTNLEPFLDLWVACVTESAFHHLIEFLRLNVPELRDEGRLWNSYWPTNVNYEHQMREWIVSDTTRVYLEKFASVHVDVQSALWEIESLRS